MRKFLVASACLICLLFLMQVSSAAIIPPADKTHVIQAALEKMASYKIRDIQRFAGRKLTLKEKVSFWVLKGHIKHSDNNNLARNLANKLFKKKAFRKGNSGNPEDSKSKGQTAFVFGLVSVGLLIAGLFIPYVILGSLVSAALAIALGTIAYKKDPSDGKAKAGKLLGWITLGLFALLLIIVLIALSNSSWW